MHLPPIHPGFLNHHNSNVFLGTCSCNYSRFSFWMLKVRLGYFSGGHELCLCLELCLNIEASPSFSDMFLPCVSLSDLRSSRPRSRPSSCSISMGIRQHMPVIWVHTKLPHSISYDLVIAWLCYFLISLILMHTYIITNLPAGFSSEVVRKCKSWEVLSFWSQIDFIFSFQSKYISFPIIWSLQQCGCYVNPSFLRRICIWEPFALFGKTGFIFKLCSSTN